jgi:hypothetical protein
MCTSLKFTASVPNMPRGYELETRLMLMVPRLDDDSIHIYSFFVNPRLAAQSKISFASTELKLKLSTCISFILHEHIDFK